MARPRLIEQVKRFSREHCHRAQELLRDHGIGSYITSHIGAVSHFYSPPSVQIEIYTNIGGLKPLASYWLPLKGSLNSVEKAKYTARYCIDLALKSYAEKLEPEQALIVLAVAAEVRGGT